MSELHENPSAMTKTQRRLDFHGSFEALVQVLGEVLPVEQRTLAQQRLLEDAEFQVKALRGGQFKLHPTPIRSLERKAARHARMLAALEEGLRTGAVTIRSVAP